MPFRNFAPIIIVSVCGWLLPHASAHGPHILSTEPAPFPPHFLPVVAPGEVIDVTVRIPETEEESLIEAPVARQLATSPWPTRLAGVSVKARFRHFGGATRVFDLPVGRVEQLPRLGFGLVLSVTTQIPFEAEARPLRVFGNDGPNSVACLTVVIEREESPPVCHEVLPAHHRLRSTRRDFPAFLHSDGRAVTDSQPARSGETITVLATGMGITNFPARTGEETRAPNAAIDVSCCQLGFDFDSPRLPLVEGGSAGFDRQRPESIRLKPGEVGVYEIVFRMPAAPAGLRPCGPLSVDQLPGVNARLTLSGLGGPQSSALFCAALGNPFSR